MPKLKSGRHVGVEPASLLNTVKFGSPEEIYSFVLTYRLSVHGPEDICQILPVIYFEDGNGEPPNAPMYRSGFSVQDVLSGKAGWTSEEISEFDLWLKENKQLNAWLASNYKEIDEAIKSSLLWNSKFITDGKETGVAQ
jgi:hypothetical protein